MIYIVSQTSVSLFYISSNKIHFWHTQCQKQIWNSYETLESSGEMNLMMKFYLRLHSFSELWNVFSQVPMGNCFRCYSVSGVTIILIIPIKGGNLCGFNCFMSTATEQYNTLPDWYNISKNPGATIKLTNKQKKLHFHCLKNTNAWFVINTHTSRPKRRKTPTVTKAHFQT